MATWKELSEFSWYELSNFTWDQLKRLTNDELIALSEQTIEKLNQDKFPFAEHLKTVLAGIVSGIATDTIESVDWHDSLIHFLLFLKSLIQ